MDLCAVISGSHVDGKRRKNKKNEPKELPDDIIFEIFSWLPAKSLCKFKCCSKSVFELTKDTYFATKQSQNSLLKDDSFFFIQRNTLNLNGGKVEMHALRGQKASSCVVPPNFLDFLRRCPKRIIASSNGLLLCETTSKRSPKQLMICNPTTQSCSYIPYPQNPDGVYGFGFAFECNSDGYKLLAFEINYEQCPLTFGFKIYDPKEGVWKARETSFFVGYGYVDFEFPIFYKGDIHLISYSPSNYNSDSHFSRPHIMVYNIESDISRMLNLPEELIKTPQDRHRLRIFKWGTVGRLDESICLVKFDKWETFKIWILTDYESSCWSKFLEISLEEMGLEKENSVVFGYTVMNGNSLVFGTRKNVFRYDLIGERERRLERICEHGFEWEDLRFFSYSSTFRSCGIGAQTLH